MPTTFEDLKETLSYSREDKRCSCHGIFINIVFGLIVFEQENLMQQYLRCNLLGI